MSVGTVVATHVYGLTHGSIMGVTFCGRYVGPKWVAFGHIEQYDCQKCKAADRRIDAGLPSRGKWGSRLSLGQDKDGVLSSTNSVLSSTKIDYCRECQHPIDAHEQVNDHHDCTDLYVDPVTGEESSCTCSRTCCFEERCPGRSLTHTCCICLDQPLGCDKDGRV